MFGTKLLVQAPYQHLRNVLSYSSFNTYRKPWQSMTSFKAKYVSLFATSLIFAIVVTCLFYLFRLNNGGLSLILSGLVIAVVFYLYQYVGEKRLRRARLNEQEKCIQAYARANLYLRTIESLAIAIDAKDRTSRGHLRRTQVYATELGRALGVSAEKHEALKTGALLHDIGKLAVPQYILNKPEKLTQAEAAKIRIHPTVGGDILSSVNFPYPVEDVVRYHHEKWDGSGYPKGLKAESIPLVTRIFSVADFYDTKRCDGPFSAGLKREEAIALLKSSAGTSFDPDIVATFVAHVNEFDQLITPHDLLEQVQSNDLVEDEVLSPPEGDTSRALTVPDGNAGFQSIVDAQWEVVALNEIARTIGSSLSLKDTVTLVSSKLRAIVPFDICVIYLVDEESGQAVPVHVCGENSEAFSNRRINIGDGIAGWVIASGQPSNSWSPEIDFLRFPSDIAVTINHALAAPLSRDDGAFGAITLYSQSKQPYTSEHFRLLDVVAQNVSSAVNNSLTFEKTKDSALVDQLTQLPNARAFYMTLEQRIAECQRLKNREPITVMSINLDDFKALNNTLGHATGDRLLKGIATVMKDQLRQMDLLARYAGDEFVAILPMASHKTSFLIAERIQAAIREHSFPERANGSAGVGVSIGIASHPEDGETAESLLAIARRNMQSDKRARNDPQNSNVLRMQVVSGHSDVMGGI